MNSDITAKLKSIIGKYLDNVELSTITVDSHLVNDLGLDSFYIIDLVIDIENEFDISIDNDAISSLKTVQQAIDVIHKELQNK